MINKNNAIPVTLDTEDTGNFCPDLSFWMSSFNLGFFTVFTI
jgi:hypothetical protein